jgi:hypothetical protein
VQAPAPWALPKGFLAEPKPADARHASDAALPLAGARLTDDSTRRASRPPPRCRRNHPRSGAAAGRGASARRLDRDASQWPSQRPGRRSARRLDLLRVPVAVAPGQDHAGLPLAAHGHEMGTIVGDALAVVDEDEMKLVEAPPRSLTLEGLSGRAVEDVAVPTLVGRPGPLQSLVGLEQMAPVCAGITLVASPRGEEPAGEEKRHDQNDDQDHDGEAGHVSESRRPGPRVTWARSRVGLGMAAGEGCKRQLSSPRVAEETPAIHRSAR